MRVADIEFTGDPNDVGWAKEAACVGNGDAMFFEGTEQDRVIKGICRKALEECPVQAPCLVEGIKANSIGVWGGVNKHWRDIYGRQVLHIVAVEETLKRDEQIHKNTYPEEYARINPNTTMVPLDPAI